MIFKSPLSFIRNVTKIYYQRSSFACLSSFIVENSSPPEKKTYALNSIGPLSFEILTILFGSMLGDGYMQKREGKCRFKFTQSLERKEYFFYLWELFSKAGYTSPSKPILKTSYNSKTKKRKSYYVFSTYSYGSFMWIHELFYKNNIKVVPLCIEDFLSPRALALWLMDDGCFLPQGGIKLCTHSFTFEEISFLCDVLNKKYQLKCTVQKFGISKSTKKQQYILYINKKSIPALREIVLPFLVPSMHYKVGL